MIAKTNVVFKSLCIGLTYSSITGADTPSQSINNPNRFQKSIIKNIHAMSGKNFLANALS